MGGAASLGGRAAGGRNASHTAVAAVVASSGVALNPVETFFARLAVRAAEVSLAAASFDLRTAGRQTADIAVWVRV